MPDSSPANFPDQETAQAAPAAHGAAARNRLRLFSILGSIVALGAVVFIAYWLLVGQFKVSTDNAYVDADGADITPQVAGQVAEVDAVDTQPVKAGQVLVRIDDTDARIALAQAQADLGQAERRVRGYFANAEALAGQVAAREADIVHADAQIASAQADLERAQTDLQRRERLASSGAVSGDELTQAQNQFRTAQAALTQAKAARTQALANRTNAFGVRDVNAALISGAPVEDNPEVAAARAKVAQAQLDLDRTVLRAPVDGVIAKKNVAVGQRVAIGATLMSVEPINHAYVDANFKEVQLRKVRIGQPVTLTSDYWGGGVKFHGRVVGLAGGTGSAFAMIPAQNATGNWIKVVQRLPVRIALDPAELKAHPLRVGLSMNTTIDITHS
ncbi:MAG: HlyD family efflux transporter periplasmic adaptor subunit [Caulobacteraceae bacterium]|nr:HlyD family efflux transporter periplasmic adaptor subunit [Caulobacteraceae bacterium]